MSQYWFVSYVQSFNLPGGHLSTNPPLFCDTVIEGRHPFEWREEFQNDRIKIHIVSFQKIDKIDFWKGSGIVARKVAAK